MFSSRAGNRVRRTRSSAARCLHPTRAGRPPLAGPGRRRMPRVFPSHDPASRRTIPRMHSRLEEILAYLARVRSEFAKLITSTPREAFLRRPDDRAWTGAQIVYHCGSVEGSTTKMLEGLFAKALTDGLAVDENTGSLLHSLDHLRVPDRSGRRVEAPERLRPPADADLDASWASLQKVRERTHRAVATVDGRD